MKWMKNNLPLMFLPDLRINRISLKHFQFVWRTGPGHLFASGACEGGWLNLSPIEIQEIGSNLECHIIDMFILFLDNCSIHHNNINRKYIIWTTVQWGKESIKVLFVGLRRLKTFFGVTLDIIGHWKQNHV